MDVTIRRCDCQIHPRDQREGGLKKEAEAAELWYHSIYGVKGGYKAERVRVMIACYRVQFT